VRIFGDGAVQPCACGWTGGFGSGTWSGCAGALTGKQAARSLLLLASMAAAIRWRLRLCSLSVTAFFTDVSPYAMHPM